jgi:predicted nucleotidyltransferase
LFLFGSEVRRNAGPDSDIDVLAVLETAGYGGVAEASLASATKAIEKARKILAALQPLLPDGAA